MNQLAVNKRTRYLKLGGLLLILLLGVLLIDVIGKADGRKAGQAAEESVVDLFRIDFTRPIDGQLPPCTETGKAFWLTHLAAIQTTLAAQEKTIQSVQVKRNGEPEPYKGIGGEGQIVPLQLTLTALDPIGQTETTVSDVRVLMIKGPDNQWLLDGPAIDLPK